MYLFLVPTSDILHTETAEGVLDRSELCEPGLGLIIEWGGSENPDTTVAQFDGSRASADGPHAKAGKWSTINKMNIVRHLVSCTVATHLEKIHTPGATFSAKSVYSLDETKMRN